MCALATAIDRAAEALAQFGRMRGLSPGLIHRLLEVSSGLTYERIARMRRRSVHTIRSQVRRLLQQLAVPCRHELEAARKAVEVRAEAGASVEELVEFLKVRLE